MSQTIEQDFNTNGEADLDLEYAMALVGKTQPVTLYQVGDLVEGEYSIYALAQIQLRHTSQAPRSTICSMRSMRHSVHSREGMIQMSTVSIQIPAMLPDHSKVSSL